MKILLAEDAKDIVCGVADELHDFFHFTQPYDRTRGGAGRNAFMRECETTGAALMHVPTAHQLVIVATVALLREALKSTVFDHGFFDRDFPDGNTGGAVFDFLGQPQRPQAYFIGSRPAEQQKLLELACEVRKGDYAELSSRSSIVGKTNYRISRKIASLVGEMPRP